MDFAFKTDKKEPSNPKKIHVIPTQKYADLILENNNEEDTCKGVEALLVIIKVHFKDSEAYQAKLTELKKQQQEQKERKQPLLLKI